MTNLRERMKQDLEFRGYAIGTRKHYLTAMERFAEHLGRPPGRMGQEQVRTSSICESASAERRFSRCRWRASASSTP